jgi:hypothetical protein
MVRIERGTNPNDKLCDGCENEIESDEEHVKIIVDTGPGPNRIIDLCRMCDIPAGVQILQNATMSMDFGGEDTPR